MIEISVGEKLTKSLLDFDGYKERRGIQMNLDSFDFAEGDFSLLTRIIDTVERPHSVKLHLRSHANLSERHFGKLLHLTFRRPEHMEEIELNLSRSKFPVKVLDRIFEKNIGIVGVKNPK